METPVRTPAPVEAAPSMMQPAQPVTTASTPSPKPVLDPNVPARPASAPEPIEQAVAFKVRADESKVITQPVTLDVKLAKQPDLDLPLALNVKLPPESERRIPVTFSVDSSAPLVVPIRFQADGAPVMIHGSVSSVGSPEHGTGGVDGSSLGNGPALRITAGPEFVDAAQISIRWLAGIVGAAGLIGGILRSLESRRAFKQRTVKLEGPEWSKLSFDERIRALDQQAQWAGASGPVLMVFANIIWGLLAAALLVGWLVVRRHPLLIEIETSRAHALALFGFCLLAATLGAELLAFVQRGLQRVMSNGSDAPRGPGTTATPFDAEPGRPSSAISE